MGYNSPIFEVRQTEAFQEWLAGIPDLATQVRIVRRIERLQAGNMGDFKTVGGSVIELRLDFGPGYRLYCKRQGRTLIFLLCCGDKATQKRDMRTSYRDGKGNLNGDQN
jgi:putative addiction module killer protein